MAGENYTDYLKEFGSNGLHKDVLVELIFETDKPKSDWTSSKQQKPEKEKNKNKDDSEEHSFATFTETAKLKKDSKHPSNLSYYFRGDGKARANKVYDKINDQVDKLYKQNFPHLKGFLDDYYKISSVDSNFNKNGKLKGKAKSNQQRPYYWESHHMIPGDVFTKMKDGEQIFDDKQYKLLKMSDYDINNGHNLIALPGNEMDFFQPIHGLIQHPSDHKKYTDRVIEEMKKVSKKLDEMVDELDKPHPDAIGKVELELDGLEDDLWDLIIKLGKAGISGDTSKLAPGDIGMLKSRADTGTVYQYKALG
ncbi:AHH domain-containing protein [Teredinibacter sp. KSP-S5-2]|uniref:AHH domain-containing protein n=1 Tax=Teredinibacter sp. KSP-S5-2 TaxID=3034506 RepID=UPI002934996D|nr:AHH domain-containing protein [Teredinibacter sp. KSP-S5-2]WNO08088.1 AHH domain-containing protein [Teredinibacter sp. KSP-S5-2]